MEILKANWRGRHLNSRKAANGQKSIAMTGDKALLYTPIEILPNSIYKVTVEMHRENGNGIVFCNIYGNKKFDFPHVKIECQEGGWNTYDFDLVTKDFPKTVPMVFRMWRFPGGTGTTLIKKIFVTLVEKGEPQEKPMLVQQEEGPPPKPLYQNKPREPKEDNTAKVIRSVRRRRPKRKKRELPPNALIPKPEPKLLPVVIGEDGIKVSVVMSVYNRKDYLERTLNTYNKQTLSKKEFEMIIVDDQSSEDIEGLCKSFAQEYKIQFQYIRFNNQKGAIKARGFTPALSNNLGFKNARGSVIVITGPESLQKEHNLELSWKRANEGKCIYGNIYRSNNNFVQKIKNININDLSFSEIIQIPGATADSSVLNGWWWYYVAVRKEHILAINGVDERFMEGMTGEDDNFALRMAYSGVPLFRDKMIEGIHQDHSVSDKNDVHSIRFNKKQWEKLRNHNGKLLKDWAKSLNPIANVNINWGSDDAIIKKEIF